jgi:DNA-binding transcriptional LysR family regulator
MVALRDETETALAEFQGKIKGRLVIGGSTIPGTYVLPRLVGAFTNKYPEVTVALIVKDTETVVQDTIAGLLEFGLVGAESSDKRILQEKLLNDEMRLIVPAKHKWAKKKRITLEMLFQEPFIAREHGSGTLRSITLSLVEKGYSSQDLNIIAEMGSTAAVIQGIKGNVGISILSTIAVAEELQAGTLKALSIQGFNLKRSFYLTRHRHRSASPLSTAFADFVKQKLTGD